MSLLELAIGWVAPPVCIGCGLEDKALCEACVAAEIIDYGEHCWSCGSVSTGGRTCFKCRRGGSPRFVWITTHYDGLASRLVKLYKFGQLRAAAGSIVELLSQTLVEFNDLADIKKLDYLVVSVPTATSRHRQRGFDHAQLLASTLAKKLGLQSTDALGRLGQDRQLGARRHIRLKQAADKYYAKSPSELVKDRNVLLIDDVVTTGATLRAAAKVLRQAGAKRVDALVFAKRL